MLNWSKPQKTASLAFLVIITFFYSCNSTLTFDKKSLCVFEQDINTVISFDIPKNELKTANDLNESLVFKKALDSLYNLEDVEFISEEVYFLSSNYYMYYSIIETRDCGNILLIGVKKNLDGKVLFYSTQSFFTQMNWEIQDEMVFFYGQTVYESNEKKVISTYQIIFDFKNEEVYVSIDDGFSNWE